MTISRRQFLVAAGAAPLAAGVATTASATTHQVTIQGFAYSPSSLTISAGDEVTFTNNDNAPHTATIASANLDTGRLANGESASLTFDTAGTHAYVCRFHPSMRGTIIVS